MPVDVEARRGKRYWDLLSTLSYLAAVTDRIRLATNMVVLPYHHPLEVVKHYSTLDRLSNGRVILGVGVGSLQEEFAMLGRDLAGRGERSDDAIRAIRAVVGTARTALRRPALVVRRRRRRPDRDPSRSADLGRRPHHAVAPSRRGARRRVGAVHHRARRGPLDARPRSGRAGLGAARDTARRRALARAGARSVGGTRPRRRASARAPRAPARRSSTTASRAGR